MYWAKKTIKKLPGGKYLSCTRNKDDYGKPFVRLTVWDGDPLKGADDLCDYEKYPESHVLQHIQGRCSFKSLKMKSAARKALRSCGVRGVVRFSR